ncbi:DUF3263 domain-containing protein [Rothia dentocariosa]|uniref:DUF3263 domain-containing protein n=1 Tax=Rothia dentocariosa TaxID=2047 RepID=UPI0039A22D89
MPIPSSETPEPLPAGGSDAAEPAAAVPADSSEPGPTAQPASSVPGTETRETGGKTENTRKSALTDLERAMIALEKRHWKYQGTKEKAITALGLTPIAYYQKLNTMIDSQRVIAAEPILMHRLREVRDRS